MSTFGTRFKELRLKKGLIQEELRNDFNKKYHRNFTAAAISQYENDKRIPEIDALEDFANYFNVSIDYLLGRDVEQPNLIAAHTDYDLSDEEIEEVEDFIKYLLSKRDWGLYVRKTINWMRKHGTYS